MARYRINLRFRRTATAASVKAISSAGSLRALFSAASTKGWWAVKVLLVDASLIQADAKKQRSIPGKEWDPADISPDAKQAVQDYLARLNDPAFGAASEVKPKYVSPSDPAAQWTGALRGPAFFAYATNSLIDTDIALGLAGGKRQPRLLIIVDVEATRAIRQAEVGAARTMIERVMDRFGLYPERLAGDSAYGAAKMLG
jgi:hypothetical protein